jgi:hypothetical protein
MPLQPRAVRAFFFWNTIVSLFYFCVLFAAQRLRKTRHQDLLQKDFDQ